MPRRLLPVVLLLCAALLWSLGGVLIKSISLHPMAIAAGRSAVAIPVMLVCIRRPRFTFSFAQVGGAIGYALTVVLFVFATRMTTAANAIFLQYTAPIYVAILGRRYLGERALRIDWFVIAIALGGIALFFMDEREALERSSANNSHDAHRDPGSARREDGRLVGTRQRGAIWEVTARQRTPRLVRGENRAIPAISVGQSQVQYSTSSRPAGRTRAYQWHGETRR